MSLQGESLLWSDRPWQRAVLSLTSGPRSLLTPLLLGNWCVRFTVLLSANCVRGLLYPGQRPGELIFRSPL